MKSLIAKFKFNIGEEVGCKETSRIGTIIKRWCKLFYVSEYEVAFKISYTVSPLIKSHNNFKLSEEDVYFSISDGENDLLASHKDIKPEWYENKCTCGDEGKCNFDL